MLILAQAWTTITLEMPDELLSGCERPGDLFGDGGLMEEMKRASALALGPMAARWRIAARVSGAGLTAQ